MTHIEMCQTVVFHASCSKEAATVLDVRMLAIQQLQIG